MAEGARKDKAQDLDRRARELQALFVNLQKDLSERERDATRGIFDRMNAIVRDIAEADGFTYVLEKGAGIVYAPPALDLTNELIRKYNAKHPSTGAPPAAAAAKAKASPAKPAAPAGEKAKPSAPAGGPSLNAVVSLLNDGNTEVRLFRSAPQVDGGPAPVQDGEVRFGFPHQPLGVVLCDGHLPLHGFHFARLFLGSFPAFGQFHLQGPYLVRHLRFCLLPLTPQGAPPADDPHGCGEPYHDSDCGSDKKRAAQFVARLRLYR